jgi:phenylacetate-CoA ligase
MDKITGRSDDMLIIRGVNLFPSQVEELICRTPALAPHYVLLVDKEGHLDSLTVRVELNPQAPAGTGAGAKESAAHELEQHIKSLIGVTARVEVTEPFAIERVTVGKARRVIDRRPKN